LRSRSTRLELMDDLDCSGEVVHQTLRELEIINRRLGGNKILLQGVSALLRKKESAEINIVDLGCGGGDLLNVLAVWLRKKKITARLTGLDANPHIIEYARKNSASFPEIGYVKMDVLSDEFKKQKFDIALATLFLHHFRDDELVNMLNRLKQQIRIGIVINDIHRHWLSFYSIRFLTAWFSRSAMVKWDAPLSVERAFTRQELLDILKRAEIDHYVLRWKWAFRWQLIIHTNYNETLA
jgi:2-polyprenyl-3-methyl-5-hydroxy-6-metoxy-1,4-benzoquinol methylase